ASNGSATFDFYDGFENVAAGNTPLSSGALVWNSNGSVTAVSSPPRQGLRSAQHDDPSSGGNTSLTASFSQFSQGVVSAWMRRDSIGAGDYDIYLYGQGGLVGVAGLGGSGFHYWNGAFQNTGVQWSANAWYLVTLSFDVNRAQFDVVVYDQNLN